MRDSRLNPPREDASCPAGVTLVDEAAAAWVKRIDEGLTVTEEIEFADWLAADARHEATFRKYQAAWDRFAPLARAVASGADSKQLRPESAVHRPGVTGRRTAYVRDRRAVHRWIAPALALAAAIALLLAITPQRRGSSTVEPVALPALCEERTLPDGSLVQLNRGAAVTVAFSGTERRLRLDRGEAIFTVASDPDRPFIVAAGLIEVRALGTAFNVRMEPVAVEVVVTKGTVQLGDSPVAGRAEASAASPGARAEAAPSAMIVTAGHSARVALATPAAVPQVTPLTADEMEARLAWQPRLLNFDDAPLSAIVGEFNRRNPVHLVVDDPVIANRRMTATFRSDNLEAFVRLLESNIGVQAVRLSETQIALVRR